ncbi:glutamate synthase-related protein [Desulfohalobium retbaense]|uniref:Glutamate synthase (Ferredoxin) n=1 Tax=Desulfohalobium retbaense (strain ATCC 49708 / DSM 5692 / JCM 16813 / HR100) TaxID=485915 RepID=C8WZQ9_DESRD|nr:glutamate synthase-related protein [Desulfohalobium retbaense]ACV67534.1 Glutamate synthase (ferredoxin) [Desulfohalobium retbaense DSM 5692]
MSIAERDACAIIALVNKQGQATHANIVRTIQALKHMAHRSGDINGEGDGCGITTDIPTAIWGRHLESQGLSRHLAESRRFFVGHLLLPKDQARDVGDLQRRARDVFAQRDLEILVEKEDGARSAELGPRGQTEAPFFWQIAGLVPDGDRQQARRTLFDLELALEREVPAWAPASLSVESVVYKLRGAPDLLPRVYPELQDESTRSVMTLGHSRYSTNTLPTVERSQPFSLLGHNGEINTIERLRSAARVLGIPPVPGGSDSQDLNRILEGLIHLQGFDPLEALEMVFPAVDSLVQRYDPELQNVYALYRWFFPPSAQGPAAVVARSGDVCMGSVDALGLRPLWFGESDYDWYLSSEKGVVDLELTMSDPVPLAPGEKKAIVAGRGRPAEVKDYSAIQSELAALLKRRQTLWESTRSLYTAPIPLSEDHSGDKASEALPEEVPLAALRAFGWQHYDLDIRKQVVRTGRPVIGSMGHQAPLACLRQEALPTLAEFFKEEVAVVTNPAIDREREGEHFSTRILLGSRPDWRHLNDSSPVGLMLETPVLLDRLVQDHLTQEEYKDLCRTSGTVALEEVQAFFTAQGREQERFVSLDASFCPGTQSLQARLEGLTAEAIEAVDGGASILVLDDQRCFERACAPVDPGLAVSTIGTALEGQGRRRRCGLVVRSGAVRNLHDLMFLLGLGADAVAPYLLWQVALQTRGTAIPAHEAVQRTMHVLQVGMEKVMSTMGIHELCGYGRIFASVGLGADVAAHFATANFCAGITGGLDFAALERLARLRVEAFNASSQERLHKDPPRNPKVGRLIRGAATGQLGYAELAKGLDALEEEHPTALRHIWDVAPLSAQPGKRLAMDEVDIGIGEHAMPVVIAAMSFGSQGENSFRAYARAAQKANIVCLNGEGGEIPDMLGRFRAHRGQQVASGRFGVSMELLNSSDFLEIKVGQGAKPGEGGHLPGNKVSDMVAQARHCRPGIDLISPSNHHDIYSIEDLTQLITELKTAQPTARVSVKIPVTSGVGTIAVGVAKAGADIINLSGFEGGTGAAREHAKKYVGLPVEIGVVEAHNALLEAGLREHVELWCDGGLRSGKDILRMVLLGANRVGLGTAALMAIGCISCQRCHLDRCPRGISTQLRDAAQAKAKGVKGFSPLDLKEETENLARLLRALGEDLKRRVADLGAHRLQDLVGRRDLLVQNRLKETVDTASLLKLPDTSGTEVCTYPHLVRRPLNFLTKLIADLSLERFAAGSGLVQFVDEGVHSTDRAVGTYLSGAMIREYGMQEHRRAQLRLQASVPGNGLCAFNIPAIDTIVSGGAQDGTGKGSFGGKVAVLKGSNLQGSRVDGSTGKSFAYGAIHGLFFVQNYADSRACIRLSGADVVFGGRIKGPIKEAGNIAPYAHLKGFAFEYMTGGRVVVLGDPGPWICAGMTGGVVYQCLYPEWGFDRDALQHRLSKGAFVDIVDMDETATTDVRDLLAGYIQELEASFQEAEAEAVRALADRVVDRFVAIRPRGSREVEAE